MEVNTRPVSWTDFWEDYGKSPQQIEKLMDAGRCFFADNLVVLIHALNSQPT